ncbi:MAG: single-stranded-DNA-specific exonuclease RecJ [Methylibium sp.]|uniref:single-stranded-DNA-specific exonuclease RecJ n=1 Tax=Methylibium sp. TaxID=2067992 RepID=UPI0017FC026D|nr:single-stranded-DNA-specific exonuclease RecJ [Methylibium sp.]MBA3596590.1 single-stranded-DNA-specific exonuclease RecJ [Methylibium sp.]
MQLIVRDVPPRTAWSLEQAGVHPLLARLYAARGIRSFDELDASLARLIPPGELRGAAEAAYLLADALAARSRIVVVADYDCDGATACAVALRGLALLGAAPGTLAYVVPDRKVHGYGLTPAIVDLAFEAFANGAAPNLLVTVDNGIASFEGVAHAKARGLTVLVTDHHLPALVSGPQGDAIALPAADVIVNPNQPGCGFASKSLAGVGVMFYVLLATRAELRARGAYGDGASEGSTPMPGEATSARSADPGDASGKPPCASAGAAQPNGAPAQPRLDTLLDLVALGTVADVVKLDANNRRLVAQGLKRIRAGRMQPGVAALFAAAGREPARASGFDFGFALGPRLNAAGRMENMTLGIECLLTDDVARAGELAQQLDAINRERREVETGMREQAEAMVEALLPEDGMAPPALAIYDAEFHEGVVGIVASRLKDRLHRPAFVFARGQDGLLKGSGRSIAGFHLRDALDLVSKRHPGVLRKFGGHAMAAGATVAAEDFAIFEQALAKVAQDWLSPATLARRLATDGPLDAQWFAAETVHAMDREVWGQAFEAPVFCDEVEVVSQRLVGEKHLKLTLRHQGQLREAIWFGHAEPVGERVRLAYRLCVDSYQGRERVQMVVEAMGD